MSMRRTLSGLAMSLPGAALVLLAVLVCRPAGADAADPGVNAPGGPHPRLTAGGSTPASRPPPVAAAAAARPSPSQQTTQPSTQPAAASRPAPTTAPAPGFLAPGEPRPLVTKPEGSVPGMTWALLASLLVVLVLGALIFVVFKRLLPRLGVKMGRRIRVLETSYLGPRKAVHLLQVGSQRFLIGSTRERITMLSEVTLAFLDDEHGDLEQGAPE